MRFTPILLAAAVWASAFADRSPAQPILNRVEQFLRDQVGAARTGPAPDTAREPGYLGITADDRQDAGRGVRVVRIAADGPAAQAGLQVGDLIVAIDGQPIRLMDDLARALDQKTTGSRLTFTVDRAGNSRQHAVTLGGRPTPRPAAGAPETLPAPSEPAGADGGLPPRPRLGVRTLAVSEEVRRQNNLPDVRGAVVIAVSPGSPAFLAGIPLGAVITAVDNQRVDSPQALASAISQAGREVTLVYVEQGREDRRQVPLDARPRVADAPKLELRARPVDQAPRPADAAPRPAPVTGPAPSQPEADDSRVTALEARIRELEARIEKLEGALAPDAK